MSNVAIQQPKPDVASSRRRVRALAAACAAHVLHDGYTDLLYVLLPIWKVEFGLGYAALGFVRATYSGVMALAQVPVDRMTQPLASRPLLVGGTLLAAFGFVLAGLSTGVTLLCVSLAIAGLGSSTQHPRASAIITETFGGTSRSALGIYNFAGDVGKAVFPAVTALLLVLMTWHTAIYVLAASGVAFAIGLLALVPEHDGAAAAPGPAAKTRPVGSRAGFWLLFAIGALDTATRMGFLLFLPFVLVDKHASHATVGIGLALVFIGGAFGKFTCGWLGERLGMVGTVTVTEFATAVLILVVPLLPLGLLLPALLVLGTALNGTSSVLYGTVPDVAHPGDLSKAFALFYTGVIGAGALAPIVIGALADHVGRPAALFAPAAAALSTVPLAVLLARRLRRHSHAHAPSDRP